MGKTAVEIAAPLNTRHPRVVGQNINHHGWRQSFRLPDDPESSRRIIFVASTSGDLSIDVFFDVQELAVPRIGKDVGSRALDNDERELFLRDHPTLQIEHPVVVGAVAALMSTLQPDGSLPDAIYEKVRALHEHTADRLLEVPEILETGRARGRESVPIPWSR